MTSRNSMFGDLSDAAGLSASGLRSIRYVKEIPDLDFGVANDMLPAGVTDLLADSLTEANGTLIEALYKPWPTALSAKWQDLGGNVKHGLDLLVEQALDQIQLMTGKSFDYAQMRATLLSDALEFVKQ